MPVALKFNKTTEARLNVVWPAGTLIWDVTIDQYFSGDGNTAGGVALGGGSQGPPGPQGPIGPEGPAGPAGPAGAAGKIPAGFIFQNGKLYWTGCPIAPTVFIPDGQKLYVDNVTGELVIQ